MQKMQADMEGLRKDQQATRGDLQTTRAELKGDIAAARAEQKGEIAALREEMKALISSSHTKFVLWTIGTMITLAGLGFTIAKFTQKPIETSVDAQYLDAVAISNTR
jgi:hypothetical protein